MKIAIWISSIFFFIGIVIFAMLQLGGIQPKVVPQVSLPLYAPNTPPSASAVGGPCAQEKCLVIFLTPWCPKCRESVGSVNALHKMLSGQGIKVDIVIGDDSKDAVLEFASSFKVPVLLDVQNHLFGQVSLPGTPYMAVVNNKGVIVNDLAGFVANAPTLKSSLNL